MIGWFMTTCLNEPIQILQFLTCRKVQKCWKLISIYFTIFTIFNFSREYNKGCFLHVIPVRIIVSYSCKFSYKRSLSLCFPFVKRPKIRVSFLGSWLFRQEKIFFSFRAGHILLQRHTEFNKVIPICIIVSCSKKYWLLSITFENCGIHIFWVYLIVYLLWRCCFPVTALNGIRAL